MVVSLGKKCSLLQWLFLREVIGKKEDLLPTNVTIDCDNEWE